MRRTVSSLQTLFVKIVFQFVFGGLALWMLVLSFVNFREIGFPHALFMLGWMVGGFAACWLGFQLKKVSVDDKFLYVSNYLKEISIPLSDIELVTQNKWLNVRPVTVHLKRVSVFGCKIKFMPPVEFKFGFKDHPVVEELWKLAKAQNTGARVER
jgi:hypothetical protein